MRIFVSVYFVRVTARRCPLIAAILVPSHPKIDYRCGNKPALQDANQRKSQIVPFGPHILLSLHAHRVVIIPDKQTSTFPEELHSSQEFVEERTGCNRPPFYGKVQ